MRVNVKDLLPGTPYEVQFRAKYADGETEWSRAFNFTTEADAIAPKTPASITWEVKGLSFVATWAEVTQNENNTPCNDFSHYLIEVVGGAFTKQFKTADEKIEITFEMNRAYFGVEPDLDFRIRSVDRTGNQSAWSSTFNAVNPAPAEPTNFTAIQAPESIVLSWDAVTDDDLKEYRVYLDTISGGFTPGPANLVWSGLSTSFVYQSTAYSTTHYFKLAAIDAFDTPSTYAADDATPGSSTGVDTDPPDVPTGLTVTPSMATNGEANFLVEWTGVADLDLAGYSVRYRPTDLSEAFVLFNVGNDTEELLVKNLPVAVEYEFQVSAYDFAGNRSAWTSSVNGELANTAPSKPSEPTILSGVQGFAIEHDITKDVGGRLENDVIRLEVWVGPTTPDEQVANLPIEPGSPVVVSELIVYPTTATTLNVYVRAVDREGLASVHSDAAVWTVGLLTGNYIEDVSINSAKINSLEANKITAGTGIINNLEVKSQLLIGEDGIIQNDDYVTSSGSAGFFLSENALIIKSGAIEAAALKLQNGQNLTPLEYSDFEYFASFYDNGKFIIPASTTLSIVTSNKRYNQQALQVVSASATSRTLDFAPTGTYNVEIDSSTPYIVSMWVYQNSGSAKDLGLRVSWSDTTTSSSSIISVPNNTWTRISFAATSPATATQARVGITYNASYTFLVDGIQIEQQQTGITTPSQWKPPSVTAIDGGIIRTGEIRSNQTVTVNGSPQPSWSINTQAGAQFGNAVIRGTLIVGAAGGSDLDNAASRIQSANYVTNASGYILRSDGTAELRQLDVNSISITALDRPTQSTLYSNLFDYLESTDSWVQPDLDPATALTNYLGAQTSNTVLVLDETDNEISRPGVGVKGVTLDPSAIYRVSATIRAYEDTGTVQLAFQAYDITDTLISEIPIVEVTQTEDADADYDNTPFGWATVTGYIKGRGVNTVSVNESTTYVPVLLPETTAYVIPVFKNTESTVNTMQIDALVIEAIGVTPTHEINTGGDVKITLGERDVDTLETIPEIRYYSGRSLETGPGRIRLDDGDLRQRLIVSAPEETNETPIFAISSSTENYLPMENRDYDSGTTQWQAFTGSTVVQSTEGKQGHLVTLTSNPDDGEIWQWGNPEKDVVRSWPELVGEEYLTVSAMVKSSVTATMSFSFTDESGTQSAPSVDVSGVSCTANEWIYVSQTFFFTGGIIPENQLTLRFQYAVTQASGTTYIISDAQMQRGQVATPYRPFAPGAFDAQAKVARFPETVYVGPLSDETIVARKNLSGRNPRIILATDDGTQTGLSLLRVTNSNDIFLQLGGGNRAGVTSPFPAARFRPITNNDTDAISAGRYQLVTASGGLFSSATVIQETRNKWFDSTLTPNMPGSTRSQTLDIHNTGHISIDGNPPWRTVTPAAGWTADSVGIKWYINNGWLYVRGRVDWGTNDWIPRDGSGAPTPTVGQLVCTVPGISGLPYSPFDITITGTSSTGGSQVYGTIRVSATNGDLTLYPVIYPPTPTGASWPNNYSNPPTNTLNPNNTHVPLKRWLLINAKFPLGQDTEYVDPVADYTPPSTPSSFTVSPSTSGETKGKFRLNWTNPSDADLAGVKIIYKEGSAPTVTIATGATTIKSMTTNGKVINIPLGAADLGDAWYYYYENLNVNKTHHFKIVSYDGAGNHSAAGSVSRYLLKSPIAVVRTAVYTYHGGWDTAESCYQGSKGVGFALGHGTFFYGTGIRDALSPDGVTRTINEIGVNLERSSVTHGSASAVVGIRPHTYQVKPGGAPTVLSALESPTFQRGEGKYTAINNPTALANFASGTYRGIMVYSASTSQYAIFDPVHSWQGRLWIHHTG